MKLFFCLCLSFFAFTTKAQYNYVTNSSFDILPFCPNSDNQMSIAQFWDSPTTNSQLFNTCLSSFYPMPSSAGGLVYQTPHSGNGAAVFWGYNTPGMDYRTYVQNRLADTLKKDACYYVRFFINYKNPQKICINNIALNFSQNQNSGCSGCLLPLVSHVSKFNKSFICDTLPWVEISGVYNAIGAEKYITIGNFNNDNDTDTAYTSYGINYLGALYFVDDVSVTPIDSIIGGMPAQAGEDKNIALGDSVFVGQEISNLNCNWYQLPSNTLVGTNTSGVFVKPTTTTSYVVEQSLCGNITYDTIMVSVVPTAIRHYNELQNSVLIYPNPAQDAIYFEFLNYNNESYSVEIINTFGEHILTENVTTKNLSLKTNGLISGTYIIKITNTLNNEKIVKKLVIQK